jgi:hypothetical protein
MKTAAQIQALADPVLQSGPKNVDGEDLKPILEAILENMFNISAVFADGEDGTGTLDLTVTDGNGNALTSAVEIDLTFSATEGGAAADLGTIAVAGGVGSLVGELIDDAIQRYRTSATGVLRLLLTTADEWFVRAQVVGSSAGEVLEDSYEVTT